MFFPVFMIKAKPKGASKTDALVNRLFSRFLIPLLGAAIALAGCRKSATDRFQGYAEGEFVHVAPQVSGELRELAVSRGNRVEAGDVLFALDPEPERSAVAEAEQRLEQAEASLADLRKGLRPSEIAALEARLEQARAARTLSVEDIARIRQLFDTKVVSREEMDNATAEHRQNEARVAELESELETARLGGRTDEIQAAEAQVASLAAALAQARWQLAQKTQRAPADALVFDTLYRPGEWIAAGRPVVSLLPPENVKVRFFVSERVVATVQAGDRVEVHADGVPERFRGRVSYISPQAEYTPPVIYSRESRTKLVFMIEAGFEPEVARRLHPGQPVDVFLAGKSTE